MSQEETIAACERIFAKNLGGNALMTNARHLRGSAWLNFTRVLCETWSHEQHRADGRCRRHRALLGRLRHQAGAGKRHRARRATCTREPTLPEAFRRYEDERRTEVLRLQSAARNSTEWFEEVERYLHLDPVQFNYSLLTRSQRISHENLRQRDKAWLEGAEAWFEEQATGASPNAARAADVRAVPPARHANSKNRIVVSPMAQYQRRRRHADRLAPRASTPSAPRAAPASSSPR